MSQKLAGFSERGLSELLVEFERRDITKENLVAVLPGTGSRYVVLYWSSEEKPLKKRGRPPKPKESLELDEFEEDNFEN